MTNENTINAHYKVTNLTTVLTNEQGEKQLLEQELIGKHTVKEIKESLPADEVFVSAEYEDKSLSFDLSAFNELRSQNLI